MPVRHISLRKLMMPSPLQDGAGLSTSTRFPKQRTRRNCAGSQWHPDAARSIDQRRSIRIRPFGEDGSVLASICT